MVQSDGPKEAPSFAWMGAVNGNGDMVMGGALVMQGTTLELGIDYINGFKISALSLTPVDGPPAWLT